MFCNFDNVESPADNIPAIDRTFQEGYLSRRLLVFTDEQTSFYCNRDASMEFLDNLERFNDQQVTITLYNRKVKCMLFNLLSLNERRASDYERHLRWMENFMGLTTQYTARNLGFDSDALNAFTGVVNHLQGLQPGTFNLRGLPYSPLATIDGHKRKILFLSLCWYPEQMQSAGTIRRRKEFPSWTWADWVQISRWNYDALALGQCCSSFMRNIHFEHENSQHRTRSIEADLSQSNLDTVTGLHFDAPVLSSYFTLSNSSPIDESTGWANINDAHQGFIHGSANEPRCTPYELIKGLDEGLFSCFVLGYLYNTSIHIFSTKSISQAALTARTNTNVLINFLLLFPSL